MARGALGVVTVGWERTLGRSLETWVLVPALSQDTSVILSKLFAPWVLVTSSKPYLDWMTSDTSPVLASP